MSVSLRACGLTLLVPLSLVSVWDVVPVVILSGCWWFSHLTLLPHPLPWVMDLLVFHSFFHSFSDWWAPYVPGIVLGIGIQSWTRHGIFLRKAGGSRVISEDTHYWEDMRCWQRDWVAWGLCDAQIWLSRLPAEVPVLATLSPQSAVQLLWVVCVGGLFVFMLATPRSSPFVVSFTKPDCVQGWASVSHVLCFYLLSGFSVVSFPPFFLTLWLLVLQVWAGMSALGHLSWHMQDWARKSTSPYLSYPVRATEDCAIFTVLSFCVAGM